MVRAVDSFMGWRAASSSRISSALANLRRQTASMTRCSSSESGLRCLALNIGRFLVGRWPFYVIDDEKLAAPLGRLQLQPEPRQGRKNTRRGIVVAGLGAFRRVLDVNIELPRNSGPVHNHASGLAEDLGELRHRSSRQVGGDSVGIAPRAGQAAPGL